MTLAYDVERLVRAYVLHFMLLSLRALKEGFGLNDATALQCYMCLHSPH